MNGVYLGTRKPCQVGNSPNLARFHKSFPFHNAKARQRGRGLGGNLDWVRITGLMKSRAGRCFAGIHQYDTTSWPYSAVLWRFPTYTAISRRAPDLATCEILTGKPGLAVGNTPQWRIRGWSWGLILFKGYLGVGNLQNLLHLPVPKCTIRYSSLYFLYKFLRGKVPLAHAIRLFTTLHDVSAYFAVFFVDKSNTHKLYYLHYLTHGCFLRVWYWRN